MSDTKGEARDTSSTLAEDGSHPDLQTRTSATSLRVICFTGYRSQSEGNAFSNPCQPRPISGGSEPIVPHLFQNDTSFQTMAEYELAILNVTEAGIVAGLRRLEHSNFYSQLFTDENKEKIHSMTRKAIQGGHISVLAWYLKTSSDPSDLLPEDAVATAVKYSDLAMIRYLLEKGMGIETEGRSGSPLVTASLLNRHVIVQVLIQSGADANAKGTFGSALDVAALKGHNAIVKLLLQAGANVNQKGGPYGTSLQAAAFHGHLDTVELLLNAGAKDYDKCYSKDAFHAAIEGGHADIVLLLLKRGYAFRPLSDPFTRGCCFPDFDKRRDLLRDASPGKSARLQVKDDEVPQALRPITDLDTIFEADQHPWTQGQTLLAELPNGHGKLRIFEYTDPLDSAVQAGKKNVVDLILSQLDALDLGDRSVEAAAVVAAKQGYSTVVEVLLEHLAARIPMTKCLQSLVDAVRKAESPDSGMLEVIFAVADRFCSPSEVDKLKTEPPTMAQTHSYEEVVRALSSACTYGELDELTTILQSDNVRQLKPGQLTMGLQQCAMSGHPSLFEFLFEFLLSSDYLKKTTKVTNDSFIGAAANGHLDVVKLLISLREGAPFDTNVIGRALVNACEGGHDQVVHYLVHKVSANVNELALDKSIKPPLESPLGGEFFFPFDEDSEEDSSEEDSKPSLPDSSSHRTISPLQAAIRGLRATDADDHDHDSFFSERSFSRREPDQIIKVLLDLGARPNDLGGQEIYPIHAAASICPDSVIKRLIEGGADVNLTAGEDSIIFRAAGRERSSGEILRTLMDAGASLPSEESSIRRLFEKPLSYFDSESQDRDQASRDLGFRLYQTLGDVFEKGPGAAISTVLPLYPQWKASDSRYGHVLQMAAFLNDQTLVAMLLSRRVDVNASGHYYGTALQAAARCGHGVMVNQLLEAGAQVNILQGKWQTALRAAIVGSHEDIVLTLLDHGADVRLALEVNESNHSNDTASSCLQLAVSTGKVAIVKALLEAGAVASDDDSTKLAGVRVLVDQPPLIMSANQGNMAITKALLDSGADVNVAGRKPYNYGSFQAEHASPLNAAIANKHPDVVKLLLEHGADVNQTVDECRSALVLAVKLKDQSLVRVLLKAGADVHRLIWCGTVLTEAAEHDHLGIVEDLLAAGAKVDVGQGLWINPVKRALEEPVLGPKDFCVAEILFERLMETQDPGPLIEEALSEATEKGNSKAMSLILEYLPVTVSRFGQACAAGSEHAVRQMLERGVCLREADDNGDYPLHVAASHLQPAIIGILLQHGADLNSNNRRGKTPLQTALEACAAPRLEFLDPKRDKSKPFVVYGAPTRRSTHCRCEEIASALLNSGASLVSVTGDLAGPPLHLACLIGSKATVVQLLEKGVDVNEIGGHFKHVLFIALVTRRPDLVTLLLEHGADPNYLHEGYGTPLHLAGKMDAIISAKQLLEFGADAAKVDADGKLPLEVTLKRAADDEKNYIRSGDDLQTLLKAAGGEVEVTEEVLLDAAQTQGPRRLFELLDRDDDIVISEQTAIAVLHFDHGFGRCRFAEMTDRLMKRTGDLGVTENMLRSVKDHDNIRKLMEFRPLCKITLDLLQSMRDVRSIKLLLEADQDVPITESVVMKALRLGGAYRADEVLVKDKAKNRTTNTLLEMMWERNPNLIITEDMLTQAKSATDLEFLLEHIKDGSITISENAVTAVIESDRDRQRPMTKLLLQHYPNLRFSPSQVLRMAGYPSYVGGLDMLLSHDPDLRIDEDVFLRFFGRLTSDTNRIELVKVLKRHGKKLVFTKKMRDAVEITYQCQDEKWKREMMYSVRERDEE
ncbi:ankyrin repeat-containing domain protein [Thelonectria olida]|uniref:Ankyrin repeat-containing domain protein n=1 Tax=Thelonectria olida TaxID=1576542 RepID=A0A9P8W1I3_9HYPO|nr:ankyrin repeat-containing domain protein [Thelonectria olida]